MIVRIVTVAAVLAAVLNPLSANGGNEQLEEVAVADVVKIIDNPNWIVVDTRASDAFNGWKLDGAKHGGHLPKAVDFPASWLDSDRTDKDEVLAAALRTKGIVPDQNILLYSKTKQDRIRVANYLWKLGFRKLHGFDITTWLEDSAKPLERYRNFHLIVPSSIVKELLDGRRPETFERAKRLKFVEASWGNADASYLKGHVPRSFHVNTDHFEPPPKWYLGSPEKLAEFADKYGFEADDTVIASGEDPMASYRLAIVLRYMGVKDVRVLNGGFAAWKAAGYPVETKSNPPPKVRSFGTQIPGRPQLIDELAEVKVGLTKPDAFTLVDVRTWAEFIGETSGYKYHFRKGRIPGSVYGQATFKGKNSLSPYRNIDNTMRNAGEIRKLWDESGIDTRTHLSFFCGGGWRAAEVLTFAQVMGLSETSLYSDGWIGWSNDTRNRIKSGPVASDGESRKSDSVPSKSAPQ